ncbi:hypothetical protein SPRG_13625 [Saprolegnia parasitica CBS 223.65]|uniref:AP2/ERF domain-containing protein n=1 Tax=Saprolegnia parasitica (strain CBS 223.65) TaxID=695850 RepID=A0A067BQP4_SAPPC|nr:hypothetical protein SPRG_13625 [Saprolegnia parasitica CBS 223.65]KDO20809.1 hypothetical protein SPRG_13625 [Saprolegnia parasitica CBS 223.65]|eukprot:XP_012208468.1 hypothetical protein SPRG_13625 [Saprolegnia parasitica CBS 223.65]
MSAKCGVTYCSSKRKYRPHVKEVKRGKMKAKYGPYEDSRDEALLAGSVLFGAAREAKSGLFRAWVYQPNGN